MRILYWRKTMRTRRRLRSRACSWSPGSAPAGISRGVPVSVSGVRREFHVTWRMRNLPLVARQRCEYYVRLFQFSCMVKTTVKNCLRCGIYLILSARLANFSCCFIFKNFIYSLHILIIYFNQKNYKKIFFYKHVNSLVFQKYLTFNLNQIGLI